VGTAHESFKSKAGISTSIGIATMPRDGSSLNEVLRSADLALYRAKEDGRGCFKFFEPDMSAAVQHKMALSRDLRHALTASAGLDVHYQPQVDLATRKVISYEALARWTHPNFGNVPPTVFIPIAESSNLICDLGLWVLRRAALQAKAWVDQGEPARPVAVNVSAAQIWHTDFVSDVMQVLKETGLPPRLLCLELTENLLADHAEGRVRSVLTELKRLGVRLALDDFGTGYSSFGYLTQLPFDTLKIDRVFIKGIAHSDRARQLLQGVIALGRGGSGRHSGRARLRRRAGLLLRAPRGRGRRHRGDAPSRRRRDAGPAWRRCSGAALGDRLNHHGQCGAWLPSGIAGRDHDAGVADSTAAWRTASSSPKPDGIRCSSGAIAERAISGAAKPFASRPICHSHSPVRASDTSTFQLPPSRAWRARAIIAPAAIR
jgi:EAL domain-containing protein (putative c-di-GMP-specific phosphodiesterase class I)